MQCKENQRAQKRKEEDERNNPLLLKFSCLMIDLDNLEKIKFGYGPGGSCLLQLITFVAYG
jgi:GGDEF domain-containing protein